MARVWQLLIKAQGETSEAQRALRQLQRSTKRFGKNMTNLGKSMTAGITAPIVALGALGVSELRETMEVTKKTDAVFKSMGSSMKVTKGELSTLVTELEKYSAIEGDIIQNAANIGLSFKALAGNPELFKATTRAAVDMSAALGQDLQTTMVQLGKAMQNGGKGAAALARNGTLAKTDIEQLQKMVKDGVPIWKQQQFILAAVNKQYAGQGRNVDPLKRISNAVKNIAETMAVLLLPAIEKVSVWLQKLAGWVDKLSASQKKWLGGILLAAAVIGPLLLVLGALAGAVAALLPVLMAISLPMLAIIVAVTAVIAAIVLLVVKWDWVKKKLGEVWAWMKQTVKATFNWIQQQILRVVRTVTSFVGTQFWRLVGLLGRVWSAIRQGLANGWGHIKAAAMAWATSVRDGIANAIGAVVGRVRSVWSSVRGTVSDGWAGIRDTAVRWAGVVRDRIGAAFGSLPGKLASVGRSAGQALANAIRDAVNWIVDKWNGARLPAITVKGKQITPSISLPNLPRFADGGIVSGPVIGMMGEYAGARSNPEVIAPLDRLQNLLGVASGGMNITINEANDPEAVVRKLMFELRSPRVRMGGAV